MDMVKCVSVMVWDLTGNSPACDFEQLMCFSAFFADYNIQNAKYQTKGRLKERQCLNHPALTDGQFH